MTRDEFEQGYAARSGVTVEWLHEQGRFAMRCICGEDCDGWRMEHDAKPGSAGARGLGCNCPRYENRHGAGVGPGVWAIRGDCPVHGDERGDA